MGSTLKLPCTRFVRQVSNGVAMSKYGFIGMMQRNEVAIKSAPWRKAVCSVDDVALTVNKVSETDGVWDSSAGAWSKKPTYTAFCKDCFDCFKQGGDAVKELGTFCGYLGMAAYRFTLPTENPGAIEELRLMLQRDRYLRSGVRIAIEINSTPSPSTDWSVIRGEAGGIFSPPSISSAAAGVASWGFLAQSEVPYLLASRALDETLVVTADDYGALAGAGEAKYLWLYLSLEDAADFWTMYSEKEERYYSIEGSAALIASCCEFAFATDAVAPAWQDEAAGDVDWLNGGSWAASHPVMAYEEDESENYVDTLCTFGSFAACTGVAGFAAANCSLDVVGSVWPLLAQAEGALLLSPVDRAAGAYSVEIGKRNGYFAPRDMLRLGGIPRIGDLSGMFFMLRQPRSGIDEMSGYRCRAVSQMFFGATSILVPHMKAEYSRFRMIATEFDAAKAKGCTISINVWRSKSLAFFGGFANVATQALMSCPALFTGAEKTISASAAETLWPAKKANDAGEFVCNGQGEQVSVAVEAELIATVPLADAYDVQYSGVARRAIDVTGVKVHPGDVLILVARPDAIAGNVDVDGACWGVGTSSPFDVDFSTTRVGVSPFFQFA